MVKKQVVNPKKQIANKQKLLKKYAQYLDELQNLNDQQELLAKSINHDIEVQKKKNLLAKIKKLN